MAYTTHGPFSNGSAPGLDASFFNDIESALTAVNNAVSDSQITSNGLGVMSMVALATSTPGTSVTGTTSGTATIYQPLRGVIKCAFIFYNQYRNASTTEQRLSLPVPFTTYALLIAPGAVPLTKFYLAGTQITGKVNVVTAFPSPPGSGTAVNNNDTFNGNDYGEITGGFDQVGLGTSMSNPRTTSLFMFGI